MDLVNRFRLSHLICLTFLILMTMANYSAAAGQGRAGGDDAGTGSLLYYGWFFDAQIASSLQTIYVNYLGTSYSNVPAVATFLKTVAAANNVSQPLSLFTKPSDPATGAADPYFHVTAKYCGDGADCSEYTAQAQPFLNRTVVMNLIGAFFTERTFGVRVLLTAAQEELMDEGVKRSGRGQNSEEPRSFTRDDYPGIVFEDQEQNFSPSQSKAHITLGCAPGIPAVTTGPDLLGIVAYEAEEQTPPNYVDYQLKGIGVLRHYNSAGSTAEMAFALYPNQRVVTSATFEAYYMPPNNRAADGLLLSQRVSITILLLWIMYVFFNSRN